MEIKQKGGLKMENIYIFRENENEELEKLIEQLAIKKLIFRNKIYMQHHDKDEFTLYREIKKMEQEISNIRQGQLLL